MSIALATRGIISGIGGGGTGPGETIYAERLAAAIVNQALVAAITEDAIMTDIEEFDELAAQIHAEILMADLTEDTIETDVDG